MSKFTPVIIVIIAVLFFVLSNHSTKTVVQIHTLGKTYNIMAEVANTDNERADGLMWRRELPEDEGMLFVYAEEGMRSFWMKNVLISLDMLFIGADNRIKHIEKSVPICLLDKKQCESYSSQVPVLNVLELQAGFSEKYNVNIGDTVTLD